MGNSLLDMKVKILKKYIDEAKSHALERSHYYGKAVMHYVRFNNIIKGMIGEHIIKAVLRINKIPFEVDFTELGEADRFDIKVKDKLIEVKTISDDTKFKQLVISKYSFDKGKMLDYYVLVEIDKEWEIAEIKGYATKNDFINISKVHDLKTRKVYAIPISKLRPFKQLLEKLKKA